MTDPINVNHPRFPIAQHNVIYDDGEFAVAFSIWDNSDPGVGMRWNHSQGGGGSGIGFPNSRSRPSWFIVPDAIAIAVLQGMLAMNFPDKDTARIKEALRQLDSA
jgi:hypothetical protein